MTEHVVKRWTRYGHDRLYVETADGTRLGYWDNKTGQPVADDPAHLPAVQAAAAAFTGTLTAPVTVPAPVALPEAPTSVPALAQPAAAVPVPAALPRPSAAPVPPDPTPPVLAPEAAGPVEPAAVAAAPIKPTGETAVSVEPPAAAAPAERAWTDLSLNRPGQAAREQAVAHRKAAPVKTLLARVLRVHTDERAWRIGADGEEAVAARLARLGPDWRVLHAVPVGENGSDIDHVVVGPAGVFTVNAKHHPHASVWVGGNTFMVNGHRQPYVRNSRHEARRAARLLTAACGFPVTATGLIAVMGAHEGFTVREQPPGGDVHVLTRKEVDRWLTGRLGGVLDPGQVEAVHEAARRSTTWIGSTGGPPRSA